MKEYELQKLLTVCKMWYRVAYSEPVSILYPSCIHPVSILYPACIV